MSLMASASATAGFIMHVPVHCTHAIFHCVFLGLVHAHCRRIARTQFSTARLSASSLRRPAKPRRPPFSYLLAYVFSLRTYAFTRLRAAAELSRMGLRWLARRYAIFWAELSWVQAWSELVYVDFSCLPLGGDVGELNHMYSTPS